MQLEQHAKIPSHRKPSPFTTDIAVEMLTCEIKAVFGLDRYYAHHIALMLRTANSKSKYKRLHEKPDLPAIHDSDPSSTKALVASTRDTVQTLHQLGTTPWMLCHLPMLVKLSRDELLSKAALLAGSRLFSHVSEGIPLLLLPRATLERTLKNLGTETLYLSQHRNRIYFMADTLKVCVGSVCCGVAMAGATRILKVDLVKLACTMDILKYYRLDRNYILTHMDIFLISNSNLENRLDLITRAINSPHVCAALHAASRLPTPPSVWPSYSIVLDDRGNYTDRNDNTAPKRKTRLTSDSPQTQYIDRNIRDDDVTMNSAVADRDAHISRNILDGDVTVNSAAADRDAGISTAAPTNAKYSSNIEDLEEILKDYVPPPNYVYKLSKSLFIKLCNRKLAKRRSMEGDCEL